MTPLSIYSLTSILKSLGEAAQCHTRSEGTTAFSSRPNVEFISVRHAPLDLILGMYAMGGNSMSSNFRHLCLPFLRETMVQLSLAYTLNLLLEPSHKVFRSNCNKLAQLYFRTFSCAQEAE